MEKVFRVASKIADKIVIMDRDPQTIETAATIMAGHVEDPVSKLKELGIDITPEIEELKQVFAEISGKKLREKPEGQKSRSSLSSEARGLLGLLRGLKLAGYTDASIEGLRAELNGKIDELMENPAKNLELIGLYSVVLRLVEKGDFEGVEELLRTLKG